MGLPGVGVAAGMDIVVVLMKVLISSVSFEILPVGTRERGLTPLGVRVGPRHRAARADDIGAVLGGYN